MLDSKKYQNSEELRSIPIISSPQNDSEHSRTLKIGSQPQKSENFAHREIEEPREFEEPSLLKPSKKIKKKRNLYKKIDDSVRMQLFEAVTKKGEMLKTAASRLKINYSSAKSILFTFRKEGRICKKTEKTRKQKIYYDDKMLSKKSHIKKETDSEAGNSEISSSIFQDKQENQTFRVSSPKQESANERESNISKSDLDHDKSSNLLMYIDCFSKATTVLEKVRSMAEIMLLESNNEKKGECESIKTHLKMSLNTVIPTLKDLTYELQLIDSSLSGTNQLNLPAPNHGDSRGQIIPFQKYVQMLPFQPLLIMKPSPQMTDPK